MARGKYIPKFGGRFSIKAIALVLTVGGAIGGTVAWLIATPDPVVNTFTYGDINIDLDETDTGRDNDNDPTTNEYEMLPGRSITKDPVITVKAKSEAMWLFVQMKKSDNFDTFMEYTMADGWTALPGEDGIYYRHVAENDVATADLRFQVIKDNTVLVKESVTKEQLNALDSNLSYPTLTVTAYAVQSAGNSGPAEAWSKVNTNP